MRLVSSSASASANQLTATALFIMHMRARARARDRAVVRCHAGMPFYVNPYSQESTWDKPEEFENAEWEGRLSTLV